MVRDSQRKSLWEAMLEAGYQRRYFHAKSAKVSKAERRIQIVLAVLSSSAMFTALTDVGQAWLWKVLSTVTALVAAVQPFLNLTRESVQLRDLGTQWHQLEVEYEAMWRTVDLDGFSEDQFNQLRSREVGIANAATDLPTDDVNLQEASYRQVLISRGLAQ